MRRVVIESPYAGNVERNARYLDACIRDCLRRGETPYASHRMLTSALRDSDPDERALGIRAGFEMRAGTEATVVYTDLGISHGMDLGIQHAETLLETDGSIHTRIEFRQLGGEWEQST